MTNNAADFDVIVIGLGPVGCTTALLLAEAGLRVAAIERDSEVYQLPRAVNLDGEIIRALQKVGRGQIVQDMMQPVRPGARVGFANSQREWLFGQATRDFGVNGWQPANMFDQPEFENYLRNEVCEHPAVTAFIGYSANALTNEGKHVLVSLAPSKADSQEAIAGSYVIACDGASSGVRKDLDIGWLDLGYDHHWLVVDVVIQEGHTLTNDTLQVCDPDRIHTYVCTKDPYRRWEFKMHPGETAEEMLAEDRIHELIDPWTPGDTYRIRRSAVYQFHAANAERWREGRVFLGGDAAHQTPPFLGQGMNTGMRDGINLGWKLPLVINGIAGAALLDTYYEERAAHAHDLVDWAVAIGRLMEHTAEQERCARAGLPPPAAPADLKSAGYGQGREQPPIRAGVVMVEQIAQDSSVGHLFSQPIVRNRTGGAPFRLDEALGSGFALVIRDKLARPLSANSHAILDRLDAHIVNLAEFELVRGRFDRLFEHCHAAVVRPDRLVFGHATVDANLDALIAALATKLCLRDTTSSLE